VTEWNEWAYFGMGFLVGLAGGAVNTGRFCVRTFEAQVREAVAELHRRLREPPA
jgi:hypothetical protein